MNAPVPAPRSATELNEIPEFAVFGTAAKPERVTLGWIVRGWDEPNGEPVYLCSTGSGDSSNELGAAAVFTTRARAERAMALAVAADSEVWDGSTRIVRLVRKAKGGKGQ